MEAINFSRPSVERIIQSMRQHIAGLPMDSMDERLELAACAHLKASFDNGTSRGCPFLVFGRCANRREKST
ncbi:hypothetical protein WG78_06995 [Amantichitinum ursilacus]|uniref:Uncharacterized protein n=1 Tax=Amantichitinum ursilacus TaxID=857265 RepID=A0A0N0XJS1_9NEIS|nr:hypothetical protein WG78_06995 [Amantichitinum ursilacus]